MPPTRKVRYLKQGNAIAKARGKKGWSTATMASKLGLSEQSIRQWEWGTSVPGKPKMVADLLGIPVDTILK